MKWDPAVYHRFSDERGQPFADLLTRVAATTPRQVVDAGCGSGELTARLAERWPEAEVVGFDQSAQMIARAVPAQRLTFQQREVHQWEPDPRTDVLISNAVFQWVPDHVSVIGRWADALPAGAWFGWQVPGNFGAPSHMLMRELAESPDWAERLGGVLRHRDAVLEPADYADLLLDRGWPAVTAWETTYLHRLAGPDPVLEWVRGTGLRPVLAALEDDPAATAEFTAQYGERLRSAYPPGPHGTVFAFRRIFCVGQKSNR